jgi:hypothetical protein
MKILFFLFLIMTMWPLWTFAYAVVAYHAGHADTAPLGNL